MNTKTYTPCPGENISGTANAMVALAKEHNCRVRGTFNNVGLICGPDSMPDQIVSFYHSYTERQREAYARSPEGVAAARRAEEYRDKAAAAESEGILPFKIKPDMEGDWKLAVERNNDPYGACVMRYAARWANYMEKAMDNGKPLEKIADKCSHDADLEGITGFMYGCAVSILAQVWGHGEALRRWHNAETQLGTEGDKANAEGGVLNPACLTLG